MRRTSGFQLFSLIIATSILAGLAATARSAPYASGVVRSGTDVTFILNEPADTLTYSINGGAPVALDGSTKGTKAFTLGSASDTFSIVADRNASVGYTIPTGAVIPVTAGQSLTQPTNQAGLSLISDETNQLTQFNSPRGVGVGMDPNASNFGKAYVSNSAAGSVASGRNLGDGLYVLNADGSDGYGFGDTAQNPLLGDGNPAFLTDNPPNSNSPYRIVVGVGGSVFVSDFADANSNVMMFDPMLNGGQNLLDGFDGSNPLPTGQNHGSVSGLAVSGSLAGGDLVLFTLDEDLTTAHVTGEPTDPENDRNSAWRYDIGSGPTPWTAMPSRVATGLIGASPLATFTDLDRGADGKIYLSQTRSGGTEAGLIVSDGAGGTVFDSLAASRTLLGNPSAPDILATLNEIAISPDQKYLAGMLNYSDVLVLPLINGIPDLANRMVVDSGSVNSGRDIGFDAAGNIHFVSSAHQIYRVLAPGGHTIATTSWNGSSYAFAIQTETTPTGLPGDYNGNNVIDAADYTVWRDNVGADTITNRAPGLSGPVGPDDYAYWKAHFGDSLPGSGSLSGGTVPEPTTMGLVGVVVGFRLLSAVGRRRRAT